MSTLPSDSKGTILLVEDSLDQAHLVRFLLQQEGYRVTLAQDGIRGCQLAEDGDWTLVITDLNLPGQDGIEVIGAAKEHSPGTPVLAMTGYARVGFLDQALRAGADDVLEKPIDKEELLQKVEMLVRRSRTEQRAARRKVLAVGAYPGAVEFGVGGTLLGHAERGDAIVLCPITTGRGWGDQERLRGAAEQASRLLRASLLPASVSLPGMNESAATSILTRIVQEMQPDVVYCHSANDDLQEIRMAHRASVSASGGVATLSCFEAPSSAVTFRPDRFEDISTVLEEKLQVVAQYRGVLRGGGGDRELASAMARYWGRKGPGPAAEAMEVVWAS